MAGDARGWGQQPGGGAGGTAFRPWFQQQQQQAAASPGTGGSGKAVRGMAMVIVWLCWLGVLVVADLLAFLMFAFADSPSSAEAAKMMIVPVFLWFAVTLVAGGVLLFVWQWWSIPLAFVLAVSPPFVVFAGYNLLSGVRVSPQAATPAQPAIPMTMPAGGFKPAATPPANLPAQPDFQKYIDDARKQADDARREVDEALRQAQAATQPEEVRHSEAPDGGEKP